MCLAENGVRSMFGRWGCVRHYNGRSEKLRVGQWTWKFQSFVKILMILGMQHPVKQARIKFGLEDYRAHTCTENLTGTGTCRKEGTWSLGSTSLFTLKSPCKATVMILSRKTSKGQAERSISPWFSCMSLCKITGEKHATIHQQYGPVELAMLRSRNVMFFFKNEWVFPSHIDVLLWYHGQYFYCLSLGQETVGRNGLECFKHFYIHVQQIYKDQWSGDSPVIWQSRWPISQHAEKLQFKKISIMLGWSGLT